MWWLALALCLAGAFCEADAESVADAMQVTGNTSEDLGAFLAALLTNSIIVIACLVAFSVLRPLFPKIFANNVLNGTAPAAPAQKFWALASVQVTTEQAVESMGLDVAMLSEFCKLCMLISGVLSVPLILVLSPLHYYCGGGAAGDDSLSYIDMGNVNINHPWLYYVHACIVWGVCIVVQICVYRAQTKFLALRFRWLEDLPMPRANTILIEHIPSEYRSDAKLREFFSQTFTPEQIQDVHIVKKAEKLAKLVASRDSYKRRLYDAQLMLERDGKRPQGRDSWRCWGPQEDVIDFCTQRSEELQAQVEEERARILQASATDGGGVNSASGFVTFTRRSEAEKALDLRYSANRNNWLVSMPPDPSTIRWHDLVKPTWLKVWLAVAGYAVVILLYLFWIPLAALITRVGKSVDAGPFQPFWAGLAPIIGMQIMLAFMPTILLGIFQFFFALKADVWSQHQLQIWYFVFQLVFVVLATAIGNSLWSSIEKLALDPFSIFALLAEKLPVATHFYMNYLVLQWTSHAIALLRASSLVKFLMWKTLYTEEEAREMAEPEDQSFHGMGSRQSRMMIIMTICIVFSTMSPLVAPLTFIHFGLCRLIYGYLTVFAETRKSDLGGAFWVTQLKHVQLSAMLYCVLMIGMLSGRCPGNKIPMYIAIPALLFMFIMYYNFCKTFDWTKLSFEEIIKLPGLGAGKSTDEAYIQPELLDGSQGRSVEDGMAARLHSSPAAGSIGRSEANPDEVDTHRGESIQNARKACTLGEQSSMDRE
mmetsp:Transcript_73750/g.185884  ORF Transcript_73750/g.185884 Transcript_73750/m.185884 type:complete len:765 (+) Transcript_73750:89-2383(+)